MISTSKIIGNDGESLARDYLLKIGYNILEINYNCKYGEIDIVAQDGDTIAFTEVKNYTRTNAISLYNAIPQSKKAKLIKTAKFYIIDKKAKDIPMRFDVILFEDSQFVEHIKGAFFI